MTNILALKAIDVYKSFNSSKLKATPVLKGVSLEISKGEFAAIVGPSGAGKSTLLHLLGSLDKPDSGEIMHFINGEQTDVNKMQSRELSKHRNKAIGFVFQFHHLLPEFSAVENALVPALIGGESYQSAYKKAVVLLETVGMSHRLNHKPQELSGGEQQRTAIARALINQPAILLADEPTGNLDGENARAVLNLLSELRQRYSLTAIIATHSNEVASIADRIILLKDGKISEEKM
ncbi:MAG: lipoprotein-releasing system ATP-binding protein [Bacteroidota bacterium]|nr:lipoprotein-releasing system ATP-binding protein [Bacteroidota bacterium]